MKWKSPALFVAVLLPAFARIPVASRPAVAVTAAAHPAISAPLPPAVSVPATPFRVAPNKLTAGQAAAELRDEHDRYWLSAKLAVDKNVLAPFAEHQATLRQGLRYAQMTRGICPGKKQIALTFDDGPHPAYTPQILALLKKYNVKATFFVVGEQAEKYPDLVRDEIAAGHSVGNHTYHHVSLIKIPDDEVATEIKACGEVLRSITGTAPHLFRPPGGEFNPGVAETSEALGYKMVLWTDDPGDYASPGAQTILTRTLKKANNGGIILIHDGIRQTIQMLPQIIESLRKQGYEFVTIDEMIANRKNDGHVRLARAVHMS